MKLDISYIFPMLEIYDFAQCKTFDLFSVLTLLFSVHNFKISFSAIRFLKAENMATTPMSAFLFILYILQTIPQDLTPVYGNSYILFFQRNVFTTHGMARTFPGLALN